VRLDPQPARIAPREGTGDVVFGPFGRTGFGHGTARQGRAGHGTARHGKARHGTARHGKARHGKAVRQLKGRRARTARTPVRSPCIAHRLRPAVPAVAHRAQYVQNTRRIFRCASFNRYPRRFNLSYPLSEKCL
jgi:hypothetical protein